VNSIRKLALIALAQLPMWTIGGCDVGGSTSGSEGEPRATAVSLTEEPATLRGVMSGLQADMIRLNEGLWAGDFEMVAEAARSVADHPQVSPEERQRVQAALGEEFPDFVAADRHVHDSALRVHDAAVREDTEAVLSALSGLQHKCIACHTTFRERLMLETGASRATPSD
jgi:cytochrome c556